MYKFICNHLFLPLFDICTGRQIYKYKRFLDNAQWWTRERLTDYQNTQLKKIIVYGYTHSPYYKALFDKAGLNPEDIKSHEDLQKVPILTKKDIYTCSDSILTVKGKNNLIKEQTSGSTGTHTTVYFSKAAQSFTYAAELQFFNWSGFSLGQHHIQTGMSLTRGFEKTLKDFLFRCIYVSAFNLTDQDIKAVESSIKSKKIKFLIGYASSLYCIAEYFQRTGRQFDFSGVISLGDTLFPHFRAAIEQVFGCPVTDTYGCCEGFMVAGQCQYQSYHVPMPLNIVEVVDNNGIPVENGEIGRVLLTRLDSNPMPLIRYEIGDLAAKAETNYCECGRGYEILKKILGRDTDIVITPAGHKLIVHYFTAIFEHEDSIEQFQVQQNFHDTITILIKKRPNFTDDVLSRISEKILQKCAGDIKIEYNAVDEIPAAKSGKRRFVISKYSLS